MGNIALFVYETEVEYKKFILKSLQKPKPGKVKREREEIKEESKPKAKVPPLPDEPAPGPPADKDVQEGVDNLKKQAEEATKYKEISKFSSV